MNAGEGGALLMQKESHYWKIVSQRSCGREYRRGTRVHSGNYRITGFQAANLRGQLAARKRNAPIIDRNGRALDEAVTPAPGVRALRRDPRITRQCGYGFAFLYEIEAFDGIPGPVFRKALSAELGRAFVSTYAPLNQSEVYFPHTKKRHFLNARYCRAITPSRWKLPVCEWLWKDGAVISHWRIYGTAPSRTSLLTDAIVKIYENRKDLL